MPPAGSPSFALMWETARLPPQPPGLLLIFLMTHKSEFYLHIDSISQMDNWCCLVFASWEEWGVKAAVKAGTPLTNALSSSEAPGGGAASSPPPPPPLTDGPHSSTVSLMRPCSLSAVKCNNIPSLYHRSCNYFAWAVEGSLFATVEIRDGTRSCPDSFLSSLPRVGNAEKSNYI